MTQKGEEKKSWEKRGKGEGAWRLKTVLVGEV